MKYGSLTINELVAVAGLLNGETGISAVLEGKDNLDTVKYGEMTLGNNEALVNILGGMEVVEAILRGEQEVHLRKAIIKWFDKHGRSIPSRTLSASVTDPDPDYHYLEQPMLNYAERLARIVNCFSLKEPISADEFENRAESLLEALRADDNAKLIINGVALPFYIPQTQVGDYGQVLSNVFLPAIERSYKAEFPKRTFYNHRRRHLADQTTIVSGSRHERFVEAMQQGNVVGVYFPNCLQGFSVDASRKQMASLPEMFLLAGGFDTCASMVAYPDVLARDWKTPILDLAAMQWQSVDYSLYFRAYDEDLYIDNKGPIGNSYAHHASGLVVLG